MFHAQPQRILASCLLALVLSAPPLQAADKPTPLQLEVFINGQSSNRIGAFTALPRARMGAQASELAELGVRTPPSVDGDAFVLLDAIPGLSYRYEPRTQSLYLTLSDAARLLHRLDARSAQEPSANSTATPAAVLNYALLGSATDGNSRPFLAPDGVTITLDGRLSGAYGVFVASGLATTPSTGDAGFTRLNSQWSYADPDSLMTFRAGDVISGGMAWSRPIRMGGVQLERSFGLRPDLVTMPLPHVSASPAVPSTADVYINNVKTFTRDVPPGPFEIANLPVVSGASEATLVLRDAAGRETKVTVPFYASAQLLRAGLFDFSAEFGFARQGFGLASDHYGGTPLASLTGRYGLYDGLTLEGHAEASPDLAQAGLGFSALLASWGKVSVAGSLSAHNGETGGQAYAAIEAQRFGVTARASAQRTFGDYADLGSAAAGGAEAAACPSLNACPAPFDGVAPAKALYQISLGMPSPLDNGQMSLSLLRREPAGPDSPQNVLSASYSRALAKDLTFSATAAGSFGHSRSFTLLAGVSVPLGGEATLGVTMTHGGASPGLEYTQAAGPEPGSFGWRARLVESATPQREAQASYHGRYADLRGGVAQTGGLATATAEVSGAIASVDGEIFFTGRIEDAFALVDVGAPDVDVFLDNRRVAASDRNGKALVAGLKAYQPGRIAIDPMKLPVNADIPRTEAVVTAGPRSAARVAFKTQADSQSALLVFRRPGGAFLPAGSRGRLEGQSADFQIGYDGQAFVRGLSPSNVAIVDDGAGKCRAAFAYQPERDVQIFIDPVICQSTG